MKRSYNKEDQYKAESTVSVNVRSGYTVVPLSFKDDNKKQFQLTLTQFFDDSGDDLNKKEDIRPGRVTPNKATSIRNPYFFEKIRKKRKTKNEHEKVSKELMSLYSQLRLNLIQTIENIKNCNLNELNNEFENLKEYKSKINSEILERLDTIDTKLNNICQECTDNRTFQDALQEQFTKLESKLNIENQILKDRIQLLEKRENKFSVPPFDES